MRAEAQSLSLWFPRLVPREWLPNPTLTIKIVHHRQAAVR